jgi:hypothetical protein
MSIEDLLQSVKQIIFVVIITPENARHGWVIKDGKNGLDDETAEPSKYIKKYSSIAVAIVIRNSSFILFHFVIYSASVVHYR